MQPWEARKVFVDGLENRSLDPEVGLKDRAERLSVSAFPRYSPRSQATGTVMLDPRDIERAAQRQRVLEWEANERKLAGTLPPTAKIELDSNCRDRLAIFVNYCKTLGVRHCPARPATCAAFAAAEAANGRDAQGICSLLAAIGALHDLHDLEPDRHGKCLCRSR